MMTPRSLLLVLALGVSGCSLFRQSGRSDQPRPIVLLVHGRGHLGDDSAAFRQQSLAALREGAFRATGDSLLADDDLRIVWYADLLDPRHREPGTSPACESGDKAADSGISPASFLQAIALIASNLMDAGGSDTGVPGARAFAGDLRFFGDTRTRCAAETRLAGTIARASDEGRPVIIVAHSLGALVTWGHLQHRGEIDDRLLPDIRRLVTLGSPIGSSDIRELFFGSATQISLPRAVRAWTNVVNDGDPFAARLLAVDSANGSARSVPGITEVFIRHYEDDPHELRGYLRDAGTARVVIAAWCEGAEPRDRYAACKALARQ